jgi:hypothetical protein
VKEKTVLIDKFAGIRDTTDSERLSAADLLGAVNMDLDATGKLTRRLGVTRRVAGTPDSLWSDGSRGYYLDAGALKMFSPPTTTTTLRSGLSTVLRMQYTVMNGTVFYSNNQVTGRIVDGASKAWGIEVPPPPVLAATDGVLPVGTYGCTTVYRRADGQISGAPRMRTLKLTAPGGIAVSGMTASSDAEVTHKEVYFTGTDGEELFLAAILPNATTTFVRTTDTALTVPLTTMLKSPPPPGHLLCAYNARIFIARGAYLFYSDPYALELFDLRKNYLPTGEEPTILAPVDGGIYVATRGKTIFLRGSGPEDFVPVDVAPYGSWPVQSSAGCRPRVSSWVTAPESS